MPMNAPTPSPIPTRSPSPVHVKVCGITSIGDAELCIRLGASAIGLNFVPQSPRCIDATTARAISRAIGTRALVVGVLANLDGGAARKLRDEAELGCLQMHGDEPPDYLTPFLPHAYKAARIGCAEDVATAERYPGDYLLVDAKVSGQLGGTGVRLDPSLVAGLATRRRLVLAGGLRPDNVREAILAVRPWAVDVASGVEGAAGPRRKDPSKVADFIAEVRSAE